MTANIRWVSAIAFIMFITGCASGSPTDPEASPTTSAVPRSGNLRYDPVSATLCESMDLKGVLLDAGFAIERHRFQGTPDEPTVGNDELPAWSATCEFDTEPDERLYVYSAGVGVVVTDDPSLAYKVYGMEVDRVERQVAEDIDGPRGWGSITPADGWWTEGIYAEYEVGREIISIAYRVYDENLHMRATFNMSYDPAQLEKEAVGAIGHDLAEGLLEEAIRLVPCEMVGSATPPTHCDNQG